MENKYSNWYIGKEIGQTQPFQTLNKFDIYKSDLLCSNFDSMQNFYNYYNNPIYQNTNGFGYTGYQNIMQNTLSYQPPLSQPPTFTPIDYSNFSQSITQSIQQSVLQQPPKSIPLLNIALKQEYSLKKVKINKKKTKLNEETVLKIITDSEKFYDFLIKIIDTEIKKMEEDNKTTNYYRKIGSYVAKYSNKWYTYMYGYSRKNNTKGNRRFYKDNKISMPFYRAQLYTAERGYKLIDCTDTNIKKWSTFIVIATKDKTMIQEGKKMKHGFNRLSRKAKKILYGL